MAEEMFKTTLMVGFDKEDVLRQITAMKEAAYTERAGLQKQLADKDEKIEELTQQIGEKEEQIRKLEDEIKNKYQKYADNYESIGRLVFDAQVRSEKMLTDAQEKSAGMRKEAQESSEHMVKESQAYAQKLLDDAKAVSTQMIEKAKTDSRAYAAAVQKEVDEKLADGKRKYTAIQEELNEIVELINQAQKRFMASYKEIHQILSTMPEPMGDPEEIAARVEQEALAAQQNAEKAAQESCEDENLPEAEEAQAEDTVESSVEAAEEDTVQEDLDLAFDDEDEDDFEDDLELARIFSKDEE